MKKTKMKRYASGMMGWTLLTALAGVDASFAEETKTDDIQAESITVTATRHQQKVEDVTPSTEVVTQDEIEAVAADTLEDALKYATSVYFYQDMLRSTPSIRGFEGKHTLILINGKRYAGPEGKFADPTRFTAGNIERIEIVRGPMSSLYGSEAMGGVINIITKQAEKSGFDAGLKYGIYSHGDDATNLSFNAQLAEHDRTDFWRKVSFSLSGEQVWQDNMLLGDGTTLLPEDDTGSLTGDLDIALTDHVTIEFDGGYHKTDTDSIIYQSNFLADSGNEYSSYDLSSGLRYESAKVNGLLRAYTSHYEKDYEKRYASGPQIGKITASGKDFDDGVRNTNVLEGNVNGLFGTPVGEHHLTLGGEFRSEEHKSVRIVNNPCGRASRDGVTLALGCYDPDSTAFYVQDEWMMGKWFTLVPAIRYDDYDNFATEWSPKIGAVVKMNEQWRTKANYGHSFRAPGAGELFQDYYGMGGMYHIMGNSELQPETADSFDLALESSGKTWFGRVGYFYNDVSDLIDTTLVRTTGIPPRRISHYQYMNIDKAKLQGMEIEGSWQTTESLRLGMNYTYLDATNETTNERIASKPRNMASGMVDYSVLPWDLTFNLRVRYMGDYGYLAGRPAQFKNDSEFITSIKITKGISDYLEFYVGVDDLFDNYAAYYGTTADDGVLERPGAFYYTGIKVRF